MLSRRPYPDVTHRDVRDVMPGAWAPPHTSPHTASIARRAAAETTSIEWDIACILLVSSYVLIQDPLQFLQ